MRRSKGAPHRCCCRCSPTSRRGRWGDALAGWTSPAIERFRGFQPETRQELAARYQELFDEAGKAWEDWKEANRRTEWRTGKSSATPSSRMKVCRTRILEAFRELSYAKAGPFARTGDAKQYYPQAAQDQIAKLEKEKKALEEATPDLPRAMGVQESAKIANATINIRGSHWTLGEEVPRRFLRAIAGENQTPDSGEPERTAAIGRMADPAGSSADQPRDGEPHLARTFRPRHRAFGR